MLVVMFVMFARQTKVPPSCLFPRRESFIPTQGIRYSHAGNNPVPIMGVTLSHNGNKNGNESSTFEGTISVNFIPNTIFARI